MNSDHNIKALKSGVWYTGANFIIKGIGFITTPIFTRLLTHQDYGLYSNYTSWLNTILVFATLNLSASFISARFDYEQDFDGYVSSVLVLSSLTTLFWGLIIHLFSGFFTSLTGVELKYLDVMILYLLFYSAVDMFQTRERYYYKYKITVITSLIIAVSTAMLSVVLVLLMEDKLQGRILGGAIPTTLAGILLYGVLISKGRRVLVSYWKYALPICIPFIPHVLSLFLLNSMDKMMITRICGPEQNALYSVAYNCGAIITLLVTSLNTAFAPWLGENLNRKNYNEIRTVSKTYVFLFVYLACGAMLLTPELLLIMGGRSYSEAINVMPPVAFGCVCQFMYTMYVNVEQFSKKTIGMAVASTIAALSNFIMNYAFIPRFGYIAAAYTTLASFVILLFIHMFLVRRMGLHDVYSTKTIFMVLAFMSGYTVLMYLLYSKQLIRFSLIIIYAVVSLFIMINNKDRILSIIRKKTD